jgi:hypothetical protein
VEPLQGPAPRKSRKLLLIATGGLTGLLLLVVSLAIVPRILAHYFWAIDSWYRPAPQQPINFPHPSHVQMGGIDCLFCHRMVATESMASIPPVEQCMFCHKIIATTRPEIQKLTDYANSGRPIDWVRVYRLPDHVKFVHEAHITYFTRTENILPSQVCAKCHGDVGSMLQVKQVQPLKMGQCIDCHRQFNAPTDCVACHY